MEPEDTITETSAEAPEVSGDGYDEAAASVTTAPAETAQPTETIEYTPPTQEEFTELQAEADRAQQYDAWVAEQEWLAQQGQAEAAPQAPPAEAPTYDPYDPESVESYIQATLEAGLNERLGQIEPIIGLVAQERGQQLAEAYFTNLEGQVGDFSHDHAYAIAQGFLETGASPEAAMHQAAVMQHEHEATLRAAAIEEYRNQLSNVQNASAQPGVVGAATEGRDLGDYDQISEDFLAGLRRPAHVAG
jgi:hypothetical protein